VTGGTQRIRTGIKAYTEQRTTSDFCDFIETTLSSLPFITKWLTTHMSWCLLFGSICVCVRKILQIALMD